MSREIFTNSFKLHSTLLTVLLALQLISVVISAPASSPGGGGGGSPSGPSPAPGGGGGGGGGSPSGPSPAPGGGGGGGGGGSPSGTSLEAWLEYNMKEHLERKPNIEKGFNSSLIDAALVAAEDGGPKVIKVNQKGGGDFKTLKEALDSIPMDNKKRVLIHIAAGEYKEQIGVNRTKNFVTFYGDANNPPTIVSDGTAAKFGTWNSATVAIESDYFTAINIIFKNSAPMPQGKTLSGEQAVALRISGDKAAFYNCKFLGFQDTLCDDKGMHLFKDCYIEGTVDFIFGNGKSLYLNTTIVSVAKDVGVITAHAREQAGDDSGFAFIYCNVTGSGNSTTYLGRAWKQRPRVIFAYSNMGTIINAEGWSLKTFPERSKTVFYGEYNCSGPGAHSPGRASFSRVLSDEEVKPFLSITYIHGSNWLLPLPKIQS